MSSEDNTNSNRDLGFHNIDKSIVKKREFPARINEEYRVHFDQKAYDKMMEHANLTTEVELGGILIGDVCEDARGIFLEITAIIEGKHANNYGTQLTFTHETWQHINEEKDSKYADKRIVGWYHTHPGFGIFLSDMDSFIQDNFFNMPYQVAVVIETKEDAEGCFYWENGKTIPLKRYWIGAVEKDLTTGAVEEFDIDHHSGSTTKPIFQTAHSGEPESSGGLFDSPFVLILVLLFCIFIGYGHKIQLDFLI